MSPQIIKIIIAAVLLLHGIAHFRPTFALLGFAAGNAPGKALPLSTWLSSFLPLRVVAWTGCGLWLVVTLGFIGSALSFWGVLIPGESWRSLATLSAFFSMIAIALFSFTWPGANSKRESALDVLIALAVNFAVLVALVWLLWPPFILFGK